MATIKKAPTGWRVRYRTPEGASRTQTFAKKFDADQFVKATEHSKLVGGYVDARAGKVTFKDYAEGWRDVQVHRPGTASQVETNLRRHVYPRLGHRSLGAIRRSEILALVKELDDTLAPATVQLIYRWVVSIFRSAVADRLIAESPCREVRLPSVDKARVAPLSVETVQALIDAVPDRYRSLLLLGAGTGMRISEALGLTTDRVDWMRRSVTVDRQLVRDGGGAPVFGPVKDRQNRPRTIPLPDTVLASMVAHVQVYGLGPAGLLFTNTKGLPIRRTTFSDMWRTAAGPLGIPTGDGYHQLRHFYASLLIQHGESVKVVQDRLGHTSATMTLDTYGHLWPDSEDSTRAAVDSVLGGLGSKAPAAQLHKLV